MTLDTALMCIIALGAFIWSRLRDDTKSEIAQIFLFVIDVILIGNIFDNRR